MSFPPSAASKFLKTRRPDFLQAKDVIVHLQQVDSDGFGASFDARALKCPRRHHEYIPGEQIEGRRTIAKPQFSSIAFKKVRRRALESVA